MNSNSTVFYVNILGKTESLQQEIEKTKKGLKSLGETTVSKSINKEFKTIDNSIRLIYQKLAQPPKTSAFESMSNQVGKITTSYNELIGAVERFKTATDNEKLEILPEKQLKLIKDTQAALAKFNQVDDQAEKDLAIEKEKLKVTQEKLKTERDKKKILEDQITLREKDRDAAQKALDDANEIFADEKEKKKTLENAKKKLDKVNKDYEAAAKSQGVSKDDEEWKKNTKLDNTSTSYADAAAEYQKAQEDYDKIKKKADDARSTQQQFNDALASSKHSLKSLNGQLATSTDTIERYEKAEENLNITINTLDAAIKSGNTAGRAEAFKTLREEAQKLDATLVDGIGEDATEENINKLVNRMQQLKTDGVDQANQSIQEMDAKLKGLGPQIEATSQEVDNGKRAWEEYNKQVSERDAMLNRIKQFVGLQGAAMLARRAVRNAIQTIKELDATMTEMAVVTDLGVGDYWDQLPEYTARANELGVAINDAYEAATLYYQQGLKTDEVVAISNETLKMARIAGLDAADATNKMTAALRGFNMELNETSAQKVADVYSELAAITASDVNEISSAMTKTASIAANAGMEFETTAAFLSQIIETTRESAETAGTAMKTVIARFQELKKDPAEVGEVDGEIVDANKIEGALRTVGVALRDSSGQFRALDDVFLELASKWDTLDTNTQRYIATVAAGSRQQSRFIAMMSNYSRTQQLVVAANNSAGASNEQFEKTLESLETKLNRLKNAWDSFTMGILNSDLIKAGIDILTGFITAVNKLTDSLGFLGVPAKIGLVIAALSLGDKAVRLLMFNLKAADKEGKKLYSTLGAVSASAKMAGQGAAASFKKLAKILTGYRGDMLKVVKAQNALNAAQNKKALATDSKAKAAATREITKATQQYALALGLSKKEASEAAKIAKMGISVDNAAKAAASGLTAEELKSIAIEKAGTEATKKDIKAQYEKIVADKISANQEQINQKIEQRGLLLKLKNVAALLFGNKATRLSAMQSLGLASAKQVEAITTGKATSAQLGLNAAFYSCPIGWIAAAVAALIAILAVAISYFKSVSDAAKMEELQEYEKQLNNQLEETKSKVEELQETWEEYNTVQTTLEELVYGTKQWNEEMLKSNQLVLELLQKYPTLAQYLSSTDGVLTISEEGFESAMEEQQQITTNLTTGIQGNLVKQSEFKTSSLADELLENTGGLTNEKLVGLATGITGSIGLLGPIGGIIQGSIASAMTEATENGGVWGDIASTLVTTLLAPGGLSLGAIGNFAAGLVGNQIEERNEEKYQELAHEALTRGISLDDIDKEEFANLYEEIFNVPMSDRFYESLQDNTEAFYELGASVEGVKQQQEAYADSLIQGAAEIAGITQKTWGAGAIGLGGTALTGEDAQERLKKEAKQVKKDLNKKEALSQYADLMGYGYRNKQLYSSASEMTSETEIDVDMDLVYEAIAESRIKTEEAKNLRNIEASLSKAARGLDKDSRDQLKRVASGEANNLNKSDIDDIIKAGGIEAYFKGLGIQTQKLDIDYQALDESIKNGEKEYASVAKKLASYTSVSADSLLDGTSLKQARTINNQIASLQSQYGSTKGDEVASLIANTNSQFSEELRQQFNQQLGSITDWSNADQIRELSDSLIAMGDVSAEDVEIIEEFEKSLIDLSYATSQIDIEAFKNSLNLLSSTYKEISSGNRNISKEDYDGLTASGMDMSQFVETSEGYRFLGTVAEYQQEVSKVAFEGMGETLDTFTNLVAGTTESLNKIEEEYTTAAAEDLTTREGFMQWLKQLVEELKRLWNVFISWLKGIFKGWLQEAVVYLKEKLQNVIELIKKLQLAFDKLVKFFNSLGGVFTNIFNYIVGKLVDTINGFIRGINKWSAGILNIPEITFEDVNFDPLITLEETLEKLNLGDRLQEIAEAAKATASALLSAGDTVEAGAIENTRETLLFYLKETQMEFEEAQATYGSNMPEEIKEYYEGALAAIEDALNTVDTTLLSKAYGFEDLAPQAKEFQEALKSGNIEAANALRTELLNALNIKAGTTNVVRIFEQLQDKIEIVQELGLGAEEAQQYLKQMAYSLGFSDITKGVEFVKKNFDDLNQAIKGSEESWEDLQLALAKEVGLSSIEDLETSSIANALFQLVEDGGDGQQALDALLSSGMFHMEKAVATEVTIVPQINYDEGVPTISGSSQVQKGEEYWTLVAGDVSQLQTIVQDLGTDKIEEWENPYTWLDSANAELEAHMRLIDKLDRKYNKFLEDTSKTSADVEEALAKQLDIINTAVDTQTQIINVAQLEVNAGLAALEGRGWSDLGKYDANTRTFIPDAAAIDKANLTPEEGEALQEIIDTIQTSLEAQREAIDYLEQTEDDLEEIKKDAREAKSQLYDQLKEALVATFEAQIDEIENVSSAIEEAQNALVDKIQEQIDADRQARENEKTEQELRDKRSRLASLKMDTSGGNALEIASLEKELAEQEEGYQDTLIDQSLQSLQDANEEAAEQRQEQIEIARAQLEMYSNSAEVWKDVEEIYTTVQSQISDDGNFKVEDTILKELFENDLKGLNEIATDGFWSTMATNVKQAAVDDMLNETNSPVKTTFEDIQSSLATILGKESEEATGSGSWYNLNRGYFDGKYQEIIGKIGGDDGDKGPDVTIIVGGALLNKTPIPNTSLSSQSGPYGFSEEDLNKGSIELFHLLEKYGYQLLGDTKPTTKYKTGGLVSSTGPAWLDGTRSRPEYVLNAEQTGRFFELVDILGRDGTQGATGTPQGNNYFDIQVNVEKIDDDYDVERMADKIKSMIYEDASYRNVNAINHLR